MRKLILALTLTVFGLGAFQANAQVNPEYKKALQTYMVNSGSIGSFDQVIGQMMAMMGGQLNEQQKAEVTSRAVDSLIDLMVPIYEKEISLADMQAYNEFFETPAGKRIAGAQPKIVGASMQVAQQWAGQLQQIIQEVMAK